MIKYLIFIILFLSNLIFINPEVIYLKEKYFTDKLTINLSEIIKKVDSKYFNDFKIELKKIPCKIYSSEISKMMFDNENYDFTIIGENVLIYPSNTEEKNNLVDNQYSTMNPISFLENYIKIFFNIKNSYVKIDIIKNPPQIDLLNLKSDFKWQIDEIKTGLKDLANNKIFKIIINDKVYNAELKVSIYAGVYIANQSIMKNDLLNAFSFTYKNTDITIFKDFDNLIFDISGFKNSQFIKDINVGEVLRISHLKINPLVKKGENINYIYSKNNIEVITYCTLLQDGFENQKIKLKLPNGNERFGIIKKSEGKIYVESL